MPMVGAVIPVAASTAAADTAPSEVPKNHCTTTELTAAQLAAGQRSTITCYETFSEALASRGIHVGVDVQPVGLSADVMLSVSSLAAIHFDLNNGSGGSLTVYGDCSGGGISLDPSWDNRISSTRHGACGTVKHFDSTAYTGAQENTRGPYGGTYDLTTLNDNVGSAKYFA